MFKKFLNTLEKFVAMFSFHFSFNNSENKKQILQAQIDLINSY